MFTYTLVNLRTIEAEGSIDIEDDCGVNKCMVYYFQPTRSGQMNYNSYFPYGSTYEVYVSQEPYIFDEQTGRPTSWIATGTTSIDFDVTMGTGYYITVKNSSPSSNLSWESNLMWNSYLYIARMSESYDMFGQYDLIYYSEVRTTYIFPITFPATYNLEMSSLTSVYGEYYEVANMYCSTSINTINPLTGIPDGTNLVDYNSTIGLGTITVLPNITYYFYFPFGRTVAPWLPDTSRTKCRVRFRCYVSEYGNPPVYTCNYGNVYIHKETDSPNNGVGTGYDYHWYPGQAFPITIDDVTYNWGKVTRVRSSDNTFTSTSPYGRYAKTAIDYVLNFTVTPQEEDFSWTITPTSGGAFKITANEWNDFVSYCMCKLRNINTTSYQAFCLKGEIVTADSFNVLKNELGYNIPDVQKGDIIYASYLNDMLAIARSL